MFDCQFMFTDHIVATGKIEKGIAFTPPITDLLRNLQCFLVVLNGMVTLFQSITEPTDTI